MTQSATNASGDNDVHAEDGCPACGERDADKLFLDPITEVDVKCDSCGHFYKLPLVGTRFVSVDLA